MTRIGLAAGCVLLLAGCPSAQIAGIEAPGDGEPVLIVHSRTAGLGHVEDRCWVEAQLTGWRGVAGTPMAQRVPEPQDVYSEVARWERSYSRLPEDIVRVRFYYQNEVLAERTFEAPDFDERSLERQLHWPRGKGTDVDAAAADWPAPEAQEPAAFCPRCGNRYGNDEEFCASCGRERTRRSSGRGGDRRRRLR